MVPKANVLRIVLVLVTLVFRYCEAYLHIKKSNCITIQPNFYYFLFFLHVIFRAILGPGQMCILVCNKLNKKAMIA